MATRLLAILFFACISQSLGNVKFINQTALAPSAQPICKYQPLKPSPDYPHRTTVQVCNDHIKTLTHLMNDTKCYDQILKEVKSPARLPSFNPCTLSGMARTREKITRFEKVVKNWQRQQPRTSRHDPKQVIRRKRDMKHFPSPE